MRKIIFCFFVFYAVSTQAQKSKFLLGVNAASVWNSYSLTPKSEPFLIGGKINWSAGIESKYLLNKRFRLDMQVNFATKNFVSGLDYSYFRGIDAESFLSSGGSHYNVKQSYVEIPISVNYFFSTEKPFNFFCDLGLTNSFALSAGYSNINGLSSPGVGEKYKNYLLSAKMGGGVLFPFGNNFYGTAECYSNIYLQRVHPIIHNPFQLALGFSLMKKIGDRSKE